MRKVMIVDDDVDIAEVVEILLNRNGFEVMKVYEGYKVFETLPDFKPDVILLDVNIPDIDGREICRRLKDENSPHSNIPILLFSASHDLEYSFSECKANGFLSKPFDSKNLIELLKKHSSAN